MSEEPKPLSRRQFIRRAGAAAVALTAAPAIFADDKAGTKKLILGAGEHTYEATHDWLVPPKSILWGDTHGLCQDSEGRIHVAHTVHPSSSGSDAVLVFDADGKFIRSWGADFRGGAHGLDLRREGSEELLYHCDTRRRKVVKTTLEGKVIWERGYPVESEVYESAEKFCPTNVAFAPNGDFYLGDGYGSSFIHLYDADGGYKKTIARPGSGEGEVSCPHGLWIDDRSGSPELAVADRSNRRIQYLDLDGKHLRFVTDGMRQPCHFKVRKELLLVPDLSSVVLLLDRKNEVVARLGDGHPSSLRGAPREQFVPGKFVHPHDAIFLASGDILVAEWVPVGRITLLRRV